MTRDRRLINATALEVLVQRQTHEGATFDESLEAQCSRYLHYLEATPDYNIMHSWTLRVWRRDVEGFLAMDKLTPGYDHTEVTHRD